jgi:hypothetical protein
MWEPKTQVLDPHEILDQAYRPGRYDEQVYDNPALAVYLDSTAQAAEFDALMSEATAELRLAEKDKKREYEQRQEAQLDVLLRRQRDLVKFNRRRDSLIERHNKEQKRGPAPLTEISLSSDEDSPQRKHDKPTATPIATPPPSSNTWLGGFNEYLHGTDKVRTEEAEERLRAAMSLL